jgi:hypothetical protein
LQVSNKRIAILKDKKAIAIKDSSEIPQLAAIRNAPKGKGIADWKKHIDSIIPDKLRPAFKNLLDREHNNAN